jgi:hypothetical protein
MVNTRPPSVFGDRSPNPTVQMVTDDWRGREMGRGGKKTDMEIEREREESETVFRNMRRIFQYN